MACPGFRGLNQHRRVHSSRWVSLQVGGGGVSDIFIHTYVWVIFFFFFFWGGGGG